MLRPTSPRRASARLFVESLESRVLLCDTPEPAGGASIAARTELTGPVTKTALYVVAVYERSDPTRPLEETAPQTLSSAEQNAAWAETFIHANSFQMVTFDVTTVMVELPENKAWYDNPANGGDDRLHSDARDAARNLNGAYHETNFNYVAVRRDGSSYVNVIGGKYAWVGNNFHGMPAHEFGHNLGLWHANLWTPSDPDTIVGPATTRLEYGNGFDNMGIGQLADAHAHWNVAAKYNLGWLPEANVKTVAAADQGTIHTIHPADTATTAVAGRHYALKIAKDSTRTYFIGVRQHPAWGDAPVRSGLEVLWGKGPNDYTFLLDSNPATASDWNTAFVDAPFTIGRTFSDEVHGIHVTPIRNNDPDPSRTDDNSIDVWVKFTDPANQAPTINSLSVNGTPMQSGATVTVNEPDLVSFTATAADSPTDTLTYSWDFEDVEDKRSFDFGTPVSKRWSERGEYRVRLTVSDMKGGTASRSVTIRVGESDENIISGRLVDPIGQPIPNALIRHRNWYAFSDSDGTYAITIPYEAESVNAAALIVSKAGWTFTAPAFDNASEPLILAGPTTPVDFRGAYRGYDISGTVLPPSGTEPVRGVVVDDQAPTSAGGPRKEVVDSSGRFTVQTRHGQYTMKFVTPGGTVTTRLVTVDYGNVNLSDVRIETDGAPFDAGTTAPTMLSAIPDPQAAGATGVWLSASAADDKGEERLRYRWELALVENNAPPGGIVTFPTGDALDRRSARRILAVFSKAGTYLLRMTAIDEQNNRPYTNIPVTVGSTLSHARVTATYVTALTGTTSAPYATIPARTSQKFDAVALDQFGLALATQPAIAWEVLRAGGGSVDSTGLYTAASLVHTRESIVASVAGAGVAGSATSHVWSNATVVGRHLFYNRSKWDGSTPTVPDGPYDGAAIASDKSALRPGDTATFAHYTSYSRGINGLFIDLSGIVDYRVLDLDDFEFRIGNTSDPSTWAAAPAPEITIEWVSGVNGSDRVKFVWPDNAIQNQWLQATIKNTADAGLASPDVFYFGNLIGDTGLNSTGAYATLAEDYSATKAVADDPAQNNASILSAYDHNRDGVHDEKDYEIVQQNFFATLLLLTAPT